MPERPLLTHEAELDVAFAVLDAIFDRDTLARRDEQTGAHAVGQPDRQHPRVTLGGDDAECAVPAIADRIIQTQDLTGPTDMMDHALRNDLEGRIAVRHYRTFPSRECHGYLPPRTVIVLNLR